MKQGLVYILIGWLFLALGDAALAAPPPAEEISGQERMRELQEKDKKLREQIEREKPKVEIEKKLPKEEAQPLPSEEKVFVQKINVIGVTLLSEKEIDDIILPFEAKEITLRDMRKIADLITDAYRQKGYITSRAYLPPQKIERKILEIRVLEGLMGNLEVKGNRYFKTALFKKRIALRRGDPFNYNIFQTNLSKINQYPDRNARAILAPGQERGTTDVVLEVEDNLPVHVGFTWDNFGSRYIDKDRYLATLSHNNLLGFDDIMTLQYQTSNTESYRLVSMRYLFPFSDSLDLGFYAGRTRLTLGKEYQELIARGKSQLYSLYAIKNLINKENTNLNLNLGFDYKDIFNFQLGEETSRDRSRVVKVGLDLDISDKTGRTILSNEISYGMPDVFGSLEKQDSRASRSGAGGKFVKNTINALRLQKMPLDSTLLLKNQIQISPYILNASEQFQLGGIANVRGYPPAEFVGDDGYTMTGEWNMPAYLVPKEINVPFFKTRLYDALRIATFYDWGVVELRRPQAGEEERRTLRSAGWGIRLNLPHNLSARIDFAWSLDKTPSDEDNLHSWVQISKEF